MYDLIKSESDANAYTEKFYASIGKIETISYALELAFYYQRNNDFSRAVYFMAYDEAHKQIENLDEFFLNFTLDNPTQNTSCIIHGRINEVRTQAVGSYVVTYDNYKALTLIKNSSAEVIIAALKANKILKNLHIIDTDLSNEGAIKIAMALKTNTTLEVLDLRHNKIGPAGVAALIESYNTSASLKKLDLRGNLNNELRISNDTSPAYANTTSSDNRARSNEIELQELKFSNMELK